MRIHLQEKKQKLALQVLGIDKLQLDELTADHPCFVCTKVDAARRMGQAYLD